MVDLPERYNVSTVIDANLAAGLLTGSQRDAQEAVQGLGRTDPAHANDDAAIAEAARLAVRRFFARALGFKPVTVVQVVRVAG